MSKIGIGKKDLREAESNEWSEFKFKLNRNHRIRWRVERATKGYYPEKQFWKNYGGVTPIKGRCPIHK
uniref:Uncharacterized protein n=1 Tax=Oryza punctata TaxID=4537 RepID=A0A0E0LAB7_ORYPU